MSNKRMVPASFGRRMMEIVAQADMDGLLVNPTQATTHDGLRNAFDGVKRANKNFAAEAFEEAEALQKEYEHDKRLQPRLVSLVQLAESMVALADGAPLLPPQPKTSFIKSTSDQLETFVKFQNEFILLYTELSKLKQDQN